jgi:hypothetical protein
VIIKPGEWTPERLKQSLAKMQIKVQSVEPVESTLEDVFTLLAHSS